MASTQLRYTGETEPGILVANDEEKSSSAMNRILPDRDRNTEIAFLIYSYFLSIPYFIA